jgi:hypothetical protein
LGHSMNVVGWVPGPQLHSPQNQDIILLHDNAYPCAAWQIQDLLGTSEWDVLQHLLLTLHWVTFVHSSCWRNVWEDASLWWRH